MPAARQSQAFQSDARPSFRGIGASEEGATAIEYALIAALIVAVIFSALVGLGDSLRTLPFPAIIAALSGSSSP